MSEEHVKITYFQCTVCGKESEEEFGLIQHSCITHLQRQLAEAREELGKEIKKAQQLQDEYKHMYDLKEYWRMQYKKLKEKGENE